MTTRVNDDVLRLIFEYSTRGEPWKWPDAVYDREEARRPFILVAVSRRWRNLALDMATLWTYFSFPGDAELYLKHKERLRVLLKVSKNAPVDINVTLGTPYDFEGCMLTNSSKHCADVLETLGRLGSRWRNVRFRLPSEAAAHLRPALEGLMPNLVSLSAVTGVEWDILPLAPQLEQLYIESNEPNAWFDETMPMKHYPALSSFAVMAESLIHALSTQSLSTLTNVCFMHSFSDPPKGIVQFPQLLSLVLEDVHFMPYIQAPRLVQLGINGSGIFPNQQSLAGFTSVELLVVFGEVEADLADALWTLSSIQTLDFHTPVSIQTCFIRECDYSASASFWRSLNEDQGGLKWPQLRQIQFRQPNRKEAIAECNSDGLLKFIQKRNTDYALTKRTARVDEIILDHPNVVGQETAERLAELTTLRRTYSIPDR